jgi:(E)-4-hydroxy-3-methyl-but-2-enyl pyrophosphate reductase
MRVILAKSAGFCQGVRIAIDKARSLAGEQGHVYTDGPLIHNDEMTAQLRKEGITEATDPRSLDKATLVIRAHGIPPQRRAELMALPANLVDATCPIVAGIQKLTAQYAARGYGIVIFGDHGHAEVMGLLGHAAEKGFVICKPEDVEDLPEIDPVCLVSQSTQLPAAYEQIARAVRSRFAHVEVLDTICRSTKNRQEELVRMADEVDAIVVAGAGHSANTLRLVALAESLRPAFHVQTADQLDPDAFRDFHTVGLTAGASTPDFVIEDVKKKLEEFGE